MHKNLISFEVMDFGHCLRNEFTGYIIKELIDKRKSINLVGGRGTGKTRLLQDIRACKLPDVKIVHVDLKAYTNQYSGLLREIHSQLDLNGEVPGKLDRLFDGLEKEPVHYLVFLDNYDALLSNPDMDKGFDVAFFDDLNFMKNKDNISLLCTSSSVHNSLPVYIAGKSHRNSWLTLEIETISPLTRSQASEELDRQLIEHAKVNPVDEKSLLLDYIHDRSQPYNRLCFLAKNIINQTSEMQAIKFKKRLNKWIRQFNKQYRIGAEKKLTKWRQLIDRIKMALGLNGIRIPIIGPIWAFFKKKYGL